MAGGGAAAVPPLELTPAQARRLYAYNREVFDRIRRAAKRRGLLAARRNREIGHRSIFDTLVHVLNVHEVWLGYILPGRPESDLERLFADPARRPKDWAAFDRYARRVWATVDARLAALRPADLGRRVSVFWLRGRYTASDGIVQASLEQAHHLGEIIGALWQEEIEPPPMTWIAVGRSLRPPLR